MADFNEDADVNTATAPGSRIDAADLSIWKEGRIPSRRGDRGYNAVFLGWNRAEQRDAKLQPSYAITLPEGAAANWKLNRDSALVLSLAALDQDAPRLNEKDDDKKKDPPKDKKARESPDFTVELTASGGIAVARPLSLFGTVPPPLKVRFTKLAILDHFAYDKPSEPVFQSISLPLAAFSEVNPKFDGAALKTIRFRFNRTARSAILLSKVGFE